MATLGRNIVFPIKNADGTPFHGLVLRKSTVDSVVMSLGDKITGEVYYKDNSLAVTMQEYIEYQPNDNNDAVRYVLVNPPTIVREGMVSDNNDLKGMTKYSFEFYHPMYQLSNIPFTDVAVSDDEAKYLSQNKTFNWIGHLPDFAAKMNKNLQGTQWVVIVNTATISQEKLDKLSDVLPFDKVFISDACKTAYDTWEVPFVIDSLHRGEYFDINNNDYYDQGKRFVIVFGEPSNEILDTNGQPFVFRFGQGVGLKNNSRTPKNNKIVTRIVGYGSENNIPYGYPQIVWEGNQDWDYTINNDSTAPNSYPIYKGIVGGQYVKLIKHPFTRTTLMPTVYVESVNKKVNPYATGYDPNTEIVDYYDADQTYPNPIVPSAPSVEIHQFDIKPQLGDALIVGVEPYDEDKYITLEDFNTALDAMYRPADEREKPYLFNFKGAVNYYGSIDVKNNGGSISVEYHVWNDWDAKERHATFTSDRRRLDYLFFIGDVLPEPVWDDSMDDDGNYLQSYFKMTLPQLDFDLYACASITEAMQINMRSGDCIGCTFEVSIDWDDYKKNFYNGNGDFDPVPHTEAGDGHVRDITKYPDTSKGDVTLIVKKDLDTFGTLMPDVYRQPKTGDKFVILGISLPTSYVANAQIELDEASKECMLENNVYYFDYPLKFDEYFLATHTNILAQIRNNTALRFIYNNVEMVLYVKQMTVKFGDNPLPQYDITLTDDIEIVLNQIGQTTEDVSRLRVQLGELQKYYGENIINELANKLSRISDDIALGRITFQQGLESVGSLFVHGLIQSPDFQEGLYEGRGWRVDQLGNAEFESLRIRSFLEVVELIINRMQAQEGDTLFTDNDQIDRVDKIVDETDGSVSYILSLKEKYDGYITGQMYGNIIKGVINTLAAKQAGVSGIEDEDTVERDGSNTFFTSWMRVIGTHNTSNVLGINQIQVVLYSDNEVPAGKNFVPCELMTIARWGCVDYANPEDPDYETEKASIIRRQRVFMISTSEGRVVKYTGVDRPMLLNGNYGVTIGELPDFVKNYPSVRAVLNEVGEHSDWLYAQGIVVQNFIPISREGLPIVYTVDCGEWIDGTTERDVVVDQGKASQRTVHVPTLRYGKYLYNSYNEDSLQFETHTVSHKGILWQCLQNQPVVSGGVAVYHEPKWNSPYWRMVNGNENLTIEFSSSKGFSFRRGAVDTVITPHLFYGNVDITDDIAAEYWNWTRYEQRNEDQQGDNKYTPQDVTWNLQHQGQKTLHLTNLDMPNTWSSANKIIFTCTVTVNDGKATIIVDNQIIS